MIRIGMSTSCVFPLSLEDAFRLASAAGYDGIEIMVTADRGTQDARRLSELSARYALPILSVHAPVLVATQFVWGTSPATKLSRSAELAAAVGASTVVVHPPFRWQPAYTRRFEEHVDSVAVKYGIEVAVENMFDVGVMGRNVRAYGPSPVPTDLDVRSMTLDFSHAAMAGRDSLDFALHMGPRLRHIHLCDGLGGAMLDEHLVPGHGSQPVGAVLAYLARTGWRGSIVAEVHTHQARTEDARLAILTETLEFAREALDLVSYREKRAVRKAAARRTTQ